MLGYIDIGATSARILIPLEGESGKDEAIVIKRPVHGRGREGFINFEQLKKDFQALAEEARRELDSPDIPSCYVSVQDSEALNEVRKLTVNVKGKVLSEKDILFMKKNINLEDPEGYIPLHRIPIGFRVNGGSINPNPVGLECEELSYFVMYIAVRREELQKYANLMQRAGISVKRYMYDGLVHGLAAIRDVNIPTATVYDLGAVKTGISIFDHGRPVFLGTAHKGMELLTRELKTQLRCTTDQAEKLKIDKGMAAKGNAITYLLSDNKTKNSVDVPQFVNILRVQLANVLQVAKKEAEKNTWPEPTPSFQHHCVITGGGRSLSDMPRLAQQLLKAEVGVAHGSSHSHGDNAFMACVGMMLYQEGDDFGEAAFLSEARTKTASQGGIIQWIKDIFS